jgi:hypothetical protein
MLRLLLILHLLLLADSPHDRLPINDSGGQLMKKRNQINVTIEDAEAKNINEYCRVHDRSPQWLFKAGAQRIIAEDILERSADLMTLQSWREMNEGLSEPIDDLLEMIDEDQHLDSKIVLKKSRKSA